MGTRRAFQQQLKEMLTEETPVKEVSCMLPQGCVLAEHLFVPGALLFALKQPGNCFFIEIICCIPWISEVHSTRLPSIFLRAQL